MLKSLITYMRLQEKYLKPHAWQFLGVAVLLTVGTGLTLAGPQVIRNFIDTAQRQGDLGQLYGTALLFLAVGVTDRLVGVLTTTVATDLAWKSTNRLRSDLLLHLLSLSRTFHNSHTPGELVERIDGDVAMLGNFLSKFALSLLRGAFVLTGVLILLHIEDWRIGLSFVGFSCAFVLVSTVGQKLVVPFWRAERQASAEFSGFLGESLTGVIDTRTSGAVTYEILRFHKTLRPWFRAELMANIISRFSVGANFVVSSASLAGALAIGAFLFQRGEITIGTVYLITHYLALVVSPLWDISNQLEDFQRSTASIRRIRDLLETRAAVTDGHGVAIPKGPVSVEFDGVSYAYTPGFEVLRDVSFRLDSGVVLGLIGRTGSGKSTISSLLLRMFDPDDGAVRVGNVDVRNTRLAELRQRVGLVTQEVQLFQDSVRNNLTLFDSSIDDERVLGILHELGLGPWLSALPEGLDSRLPAGGGVSAGESQLLAFARVFLRQPNVVVLDEAWSRLDPITEGLIEKAIRKLLRDRTAIVIAHRLATLRLVDQILIIEDGRVREHGDREELAANENSRFSMLSRSGLGEVLA